MTEHEGKWPGPGFSDRDSRPQSGDESGPPEPSSPEPAWSPPTRPSTPASSPVTPPPARRAAAPFETAPLAETAQQPLAQHATDPVPDPASSDTPQSPGGVSDPAGTREDLPDGADPDDQRPARRSDSVEDQGARSRRRWIVWAAIAGAVVVIGVVVAILMTRAGDGDASDGPPTVVETVPAPTPTASPVARGEGSELFTALPGTVRQFVLTEISADDTVAGAIEAYSLTYEGVVSGADAAFTMTVGQWATPAEATAAAAAMVTEAGTPSSTGEVEVAGTVVGTVTFIGEAATAGDSTDGDATAIWTNGTLALKATGPAAEIHNFYNAYDF